MSEADGPIETSNPSTFGVFKQATRQGHSRVTTGWPIGIELEKTRGGGRIPPYVDYAILDKRDSYWKSLEYV